MAQPEQVLSWSVPPPGLGPCAEAGLVGAALDLVGRGVEPALLRLASGHALRLYLAIPEDSRRWERLWTFEPERDPWAPVAALAGARIERLTLDPAACLDLARDEAAAGRPLVLTAAPGLWAPGAILGGRVRPDRALRVVASELRPEQPLTGPPAPRWLPLDQLTVPPTVLRVEADPDAPPRDPRLGELGVAGRAIIEEALRWGIAHLDGGPPQLGRARGVGAYQLLARYFDADLSAKEGVELDALTTCAVDDLIAARGAAAAGLELLEVRLRRAGAGDEELLARLAAGAAAYRALRDTLEALTTIVPAARDAGRAAALAARRDRKLLSIPAAIAREAGLAEARALELLEPARVAVRVLEPS